MEDAGDGLGWGRDCKIEAILGYIMSSRPEATIWGVGEGL